MKSKRRRDLTREEWQQLAKDIREAIDCLARCESMLRLTRTVQQMKPYWKAFGKVQGLKSPLENLAIEQHPDWPDPMRLFYGSGGVFHAHWMTR